MIKIGPDFYIAASQVGKAWVDARGVLRGEDTNGRAIVVVTGNGESAFDALRQIVRDVESELKASS